MYPMQRPRCTSSARNFRIPEKPNFTSGWWPTWWRRSSTRKIGRFSARASSAGTLLGRGEGGGTRWDSKPYTIFQKHSMRSDRSNPEQWYIPPCFEKAIIQFSPELDMVQLSLQVGCLAIALSALFDDTPINAFVEEFRPALWTEARKTLPKSVFEYSRKALRKALVTLRSAYGPVCYFALDLRVTGFGQHRADRLLRRTIDIGWWDTWYLPPSP